MGNGNQRNLFLRLFGSITLTITLLIVFAIACAAATFLEVRFGTEGAKDLVYNAFWFEVLLGLLILNLTAMLILGFPYQLRSTGYVITHISFIFILLAAGITRFYGYEGRMSIREGSSSDFIFSREDHIQIFSGEVDASFPVRLYRTGESSIRKKLELNGKTYRVSVEEYWPHYGETMQEGPGGLPTVEYALSTPAGTHRKTVSAGEETRDHGMTIRLKTGGPESITPGEAPESQRGLLEATVAGSTYRLPVPAALPAEIDAGPYRITITALYPNFRVGADPLPDDPMNNPAVRVQIEGPDGAAGERLVFALHPDFDMGHGGGIAAEEVKLAYHFGKSLHLFMGEGGAVTVQPDFPAEIDIKGSGGESRIIPAGGTSPMEPGATLRSGDHIFVLVNAWQSASMQGGLSSDENAAPAARIAVENSAGERGEKILRKWTGGENLQLGDEVLVAKFGPVRWKVPYRVHLDEFRLVSYPGSNNPASFESHVRVFDDERGVEGDPFRIYMNHPLNYRGFKHFQSSYDSDRKGTILSVNHDPGKWPTYFGYTLLTLGLLLILTRGWLWCRQGNPRRA